MNIIAWINAVGITIILSYGTYYLFTKDDIARFYTCLRGAFHYWYVLASLNMAYSFYKFVTGANIPPLPEINTSAIIVIASFMLFTGIHKIAISVSRLVESGMEEYCEKVDGDDR